MVLAEVEGEDHSSDLQATEELIYRNVTIIGDLYDYMCTSTNETYNITVYHPFTDPVDYNVSLQLPGGWSGSNDQWINATTPGNYTVIFNVSSGQTEETTTANVTVEYSVAGISKTKTY